MTAPTIPALDQARVLVIKPSSFGDVIHTLPAVRGIKRAYPTCRIDWVVNPEWKALLDGNPDIENTVVFPRHDLGRNPFRSIGWVRELRRSGSYDLAIDFQGLLRSALIALGSGAKHRFGVSGAREGAGRFYHYQTKAGDEPQHAIDRYWAVATALGAGDAAPRTLPVYLPSEELSDHRAMAPGTVVLHPFARGEGKSLSVKQIVSFSVALRTNGFPVCLVGRCDKEIKRQLSEANQDASLLNSTTLPQLVRIISSAELVVSVDSGPMHLASALGRPLIGIHTWSDPRLVGPGHPEAWVMKAGTIQRVAQMSSDICETSAEVTQEDINMMVEHVKKM